MALQKKFNLPPPPNPDADVNDYSWRDWFRQLRDYLVDKGAILWSQIDFTGSNIKDIVTRRHNDLQNMQGGNNLLSEYYHLTNAEYTGTGTGVFVRQNNPTISSPNVNNIDFETGIANPTYSEGRLFYDDTNKALSYYNDVSDITVNLGQEMLARVFNNTGSTILNGQVCYLSGGSNDFPDVALAKADATATSESTLGLATADIPDGEYGYVCTSGLVRDLNTSAYSVGDPVYLSASTAGAFTNVLPTQPSYDIIIGYVTKSDASTGTIYVQVQRLPWYPNGEIRLTAASYVLPTTPAVFTQPTAITQQGISYNAGTGVLTFDVSGTFAISFTINCEPSAANKKVYFYVEESSDGGTTWNIVRYSARQLELTNGTETQLIIAAARYYESGTKVRYYLWGDSTVTLRTTDLPGTTPGTVTLPAYRMTLSG